MTEYLASIALTLMGCVGVYLIWLMKQPLPPPERHQMDADDPRITRIFQPNKTTES